jgi:hypothetical protein
MIRTTVRKLLRLAQAQSRASPATKQPDGQINSDFPKLRQFLESKIFRLTGRGKSGFNSACLTR